MWEVERQEGEEEERKRERERGGLCRACELSSGRRRHWKNRTEINRSVFFAELEHELSLSLVLTQFSQLSSSSFRRPTRLASFYHPTSISLPPAPSSFSFSSTSLFFRLCFSYLGWLRSSPRLPEFTLLLPDRPGRLRWTFDVDR